MDRKEYRLCQDTFLERAKATHGKRYDYSKSVYINKRTKVVITCPIHGDFEQLPMNHVRGQGCPICGKKYAAEWRKGKWENFINESIKRFGDIYEFPNIKEEIYFGETTFSPASGIGCFTPTEWGNKLGEMIII